MRAPIRIGLFAVLLAALFGAALLAGRTLPSEAVRAELVAGHSDGQPSGAGGMAGSEHGSGEEEGQGTDQGGGHAGDEHAGDEHAGGDHSSASTAVRGLSITQSGYRLSPVDAPKRTERAGTLRFSILDPAGAPLRGYTVSHQMRLHLIVVRSDGTHYRHTHPTLGSDGTWSIAWRWNAAGSYRLFADFVPGAAPDQPITLSRTVEVSGTDGSASSTAPNPTATKPTTTARVGGYDVRLTGELDSAASAGSTLTASVTRAGKPVTTLQPYLGAFGHLVVLRDGDLGYLHVHPEGDEPGVGDRSGPAVTFRSHSPTPGRYLLYFDFKIDDAVHTARFVVDSR